MLQDHQIAETVEVPAGRIRVETPYGMRDVVAAVRTHPLQAWTIKTRDFTLRAAAEHLVSVGEGLFAHMRDIAPLDRVDTRFGPQTVVESFPDGEDAMYDFRVEGGDHTYYSGGILSHNSTGIGARHLINSNILPRYSSLYIVPHSEHVKTYANRLHSMSKAFRFPVTGSKYRQNLYYKEFPNGSQIELARAHTTADDIRGKTTMELAIDEAQHMDPSLMPEIEQTQKATKIPVTLYAGTSLTVDSLLEAKYQDSSKGTWHVRSPNGKDWINLGDRETVYKIIKPDGPVCPFTGRILDVNNGQFVHEDQYLADAGMVGLHIPQLCISEYVNNIVKWDEIYTAFVNYPEAKFLQEIIGIPTEEADREISKADLQRLCVLDLSEEAILNRVREGVYLYVVSGCDWGGSDYNPAIKSKLSYTVHFVGGVRRDGVVEGLHFKRYSGMDYRSIAEDIVSNHVRYGGHAIASDFGAGQAYNMLIREDPRIDPTRHVMFGYVGPTSAPVAFPSGPHMFNQMSLNRTESISLLYQTIKEPSPRLLFNSWDRTELYLNDFLNMYRILTEAPGTGMSTFVYRRHGSKADDALHAVNFAFVLARLLLNERLIPDPAEAEAFRARFAGRPGFTSSSRGGHVVSG